MKFGANLKKIISLSDPEWGPYWMNYHQLKRKIKREIAVQAAADASSSASASSSSSSSSSAPSSSAATVDKLLKSSAEVEFFRVLREELQKTSDFFASAEDLLRIRHRRVHSAFVMLKNNPNAYDKNTWSRLLTACVKFYRDVLMMENFAIMNYCGFSKILKKHDKATGLTTRDAFMRNVMSTQNFTHYPFIIELLHESEQLFGDIQQMDHCMPLQEEERLFIDAIRELNMQASRCRDVNDDVDKDDTDAAAAAAAGPTTITSSIGHGPPQPSLSVLIPPDGPEPESPGKGSLRASSKGSGKSSAAGSAKGSFKDSEDAEHALDVAASAAIVAAQNVRKRTASENDLVGVHDTAFTSEPDAPTEAAPAAAATATAAPPPAAAGRLAAATAAAKALSQKSALAVTDGAAAKRRRR